MKKYAYILLLFLLISCIPATVAASGITVVINGEYVEFSHATFKGGRMLVPMREMFAAVGAAVVWDKTRRTAFAVVDDVRVSIPSGSYLPMVNDDPMLIDVPAVLVDNRMYIPLRFAVEALGADVVWEASTGTVFIITAADSRAVEQEGGKKDWNNGPKLDINSAELHSLAALEGISEAVAAALLAYRDTIGLYRSFDQIRTVPSVTDAVFDVLTEYIRIVYTEKGIGSWYGEKFHGRKTSSGEGYDMYLHTAAHRTLPFGTMVKVTYLKTGHSVWVRINDRGPCGITHPERIIDLSRAAAEAIGLRGIGPVVVEVIRER